MKKFLYYENTWSNDTKWYWCKLHIYKVDMINIRGVITSFTTNCLVTDKGKCQWIFIIKYSTNNTNFKIWNIVPSCWRIDQLIITETLPYFYDSQVTLLPWQSTGPFTMTENWRFAMTEKRSDHNKEWDLLWSSDPFAMTTKCHLFRCLWSEHIY